MPAKQPRFVKSKIVLACAPFVLLSGCGGGGDPVLAVANSATNSIADSMSNSAGQVIACAFTNCMESNTLQVGQIGANYTVTQSGSDVHVDAKLDKGSSFISTVLVSPGDSLSASVNGQSEQLVDVSPQGGRTDYAGDFQTNQSQPTVTINFNRAGVSYSSTVVVPTQFAILSSTAPVNMTRTGASYNVQLSITNEAYLFDGVTGSCTRVDGTGFSIQQPVPVRFSYVGTVSGGTAYQVNAADLDATLNQASQQATSPPNTSLVQNCNLQFAWIRTSMGTNPTGMSSHSNVVAQTSTAQPMYYYAQH